MTDGVLTLQEAADELGVHYMTAYRYVRLGVMEASKSGGVWQVQRSALDQLPREREDCRGNRRSVRQGRRAQSSSAVVVGLESRLVAGDAPGSWSVIEAAMAAGAELDEIYLDVLTPAMVSIGERWAAGELDISIEHRASGIAMRIIGRIGPRFNRRGRSRGGGARRAGGRVPCAARWRCSATSCGCEAGRCRTSASTCRANRSPM